MELERIYSVASHSSGMSAMKRLADNYLRIIGLVILPTVFLLGASQEICARNNRHNTHDTLDRLNRPVGVVWSDAPIRDALSRLSESQDMTIWLDRRVDPDRRISLVASDEPLKDILSHVAENQGLGICLFQSVVYIGPKRDVARLRTLGCLRRDEARNLPPRAEKRLFSKRSMHWDNLATPRALLTELTEKNHLQIANPERVPHDLWPAMKLPQMPLVDRLTLILASLDLTFQFEDGGNRIQLVPIADKVVLTRRYPAKSRPESVASRWRRLLPEARIHVDGNQIVVEARLEDHERLAKSNDPSRQARDHAKRPKNNGKSQLRIKRVRFKDLPLAAVVRQLAAQLKLQLKFDADALRRSGIDVDRHVSIDLENVTIEKLFRAILDPAGLTFHLDDSTLEIQAKQP